MNKIFLLLLILLLTGLWAWNSPVTGEFPTQMSSNAEIVSILRVKRDS